MNSRKKLRPASLRRMSLLVIAGGLVGSGCSDPSASMTGTSEPVPRRSASRTETNKSIKGDFTYTLKTFDADGRARSITGDGSVDDPVYRGKSSIALRNTSAPKDEARLTPANDPIPSFGFVTAPKESGGTRDVSVRIPATRLRSERVDGHLVEP